MEVFFGMAPAAECSSGIYIKVNRDTGNTDDRTLPRTDTFFIIQWSGGKGKGENCYVLVIRKSI